MPEVQQLVDPSRFFGVQLRPVAAQKSRMRNAAGVTPVCWAGGNASLDEGNGEPKCVLLSGCGTAPEFTGTGRLSVRLADDVLAEESTTLKYLRLRNGDFELYRSIYLVIKGERHEITTDALPVDYLNQGEVVRGEDNEGP